MTCNRSVLLAFCIPAAFLLTACSQTPWESQFKRGDTAAAPLESSSQVKLREVPWDRVQHTLVDIQEQLAKSDTHFDDWSEADKMRIRAELLRGLQVSTPAQNVEILGRSEFRTTSAVRPNDGSLEAFARKTGANMVVWTSTYLGKAETVRQEPVHEYRTGTYYTDRNGRRHSSVLSESSIYWVPVRAEADENGFIAFFLREK